MKRSGPATVVRSNKPIPGKGSPAWGRYSCPSNWEDRRACFDRRLQRLTLRALEVFGNGDLLLVLSTAEEEDVDVDRDRVADADFFHLGRDSSPPCPLCQSDHVAAIAVDVHLRWVEPTDREVHESAPLSPIP
jgi:hypothetical protein